MNARTPDELNLLDQENLDKQMAALGITPRTRENRLYRNAGSPSRTSRNTMKISERYKSRFRNLPPKQPNLDCESSPLESTSSRELTPENTSIQNDKVSEPALNPAVTPDLDRFVNFLRKDTIRTLGDRPTLTADFSEEKITVLEQEASLVDGNFTRYMNGLPLDPVIPEQRYSLTVLAILNDFEQDNSKNYAKRFKDLDGIFQLKKTSPWPLQLPIKCLTYALTKMLQRPKAAKYYGNIIEALTVLQSENVLYIKYMQDAKMFKRVYTLIKTTKDKTLLGKLARFVTGLVVQVPDIVYKEKLIYPILARAKELDLLTAAVVLKNIEYHVMTLKEKDLESLANIRATIKDSDPVLGQINCVVAYQGMLLRYKTNKQYFKEPQLDVLLTMLQMKDRTLPFTMEMLVFISHDAPEKLFDIAQVMSVLKRMALDGGLAKVDVLPSDIALMDAVYIITNSFPPAKLHPHLEFSVMGIEQTSVPRHFNREGLVTRPTSIANGLKAAKDAFPMIIKFIDAEKDAGNANMCAGLRNLLNYTRLKHSDSFAQLVLSNGVITMISNVCKSDYLCLLTLPVLAEWCLELVEDYKLHKHMIQLPQQLRDALTRTSKLSPEVLRDTLNSSILAGSDVDVQEHTLNIIEYLETCLSNGQKS